MPEYQRIISLVPSLTELLIDLGLEDKMIGRTRFCIHPENKVKNIEIIGGTKSPDIEKIRELKPDFILANKEENREEDIDELLLVSEVHITDISSVPEAIQVITTLGEKLGVAKKAGNLRSHISYLVSENIEAPVLDTAYFIWKDPWMTVGGDTYIHDVMQLYNLKNVFGDKTRYPKTTLDELARKNPDLILLSSEPYPFRNQHIDEIRKMCPVAKIELVNGEWFSWYGSRMTKAFKWLNDWRKSLRA